MEEVFSGKGVLRNFAKFTGKQVPNQSIFFHEIWKKDSNTGVFLKNVVRNF